ncbi:OadG-related small transporter subunit [Carnobacterium jeotgali]
MQPEQMSLVRLLPLLLAVYYLVILLKSRRESGEKMFDVDYTALQQGLELMGYGMLGIFIVLGILFLACKGLVKWFSE